MKTNLWLILSTVLGSLLTGTKNRRNCNVIRVWNFRIFKLYADERI